MLLSKDGTCPTCSSSNEDFETAAIIAVRDRWKSGGTNDSLKSFLELHTLEGIEEYVQMLAKSQGFKVHVTKHKNNSIGENYCGKIECCYEEPNYPKKNKRTCTFSATFCRFGTNFQFTQINLGHNQALISNTAGSMIGRNYCRRKQFK
jgi:hypothetical protein